MIDPLLRRLEEVEQQVGTLALEVEDLRRQVVARSTRPHAAQPAPAAVAPTAPPPAPVGKPAAAPRPQLLAGFFYQRLSASSDRAAL